jgi:hypothetical protein
MKIENSPKNKNQKIPKKTKQQETVLGRRGS